MTTGWVIAVMVEASGEAEPVRHFYAIGHEDRAKAEWVAIDSAMLVGRIATSPIGGLEPVQALAHLTAPTMASMGLAPGQIRALGDRWPRRWLRR